MRLDSPILRLAGKHADRVGTRAIGAEDNQILAMGDSYAFGNPPFARRTSYAAAGDDIYVGFQNAFIIEVFSPDGRLVRSIRAPAASILTGTALTAAWDALQAENMEEVPPAGTSRPTGTSELGAPQWRRNRCSRIVSTSNSSATRTSR